MKFGLLSSDLLSLHPAPLSDLFLLNWRFAFILWSIFRTLQRVNLNRLFVWTKHNAPIEPQQRRCTSVRKSLVKLATTTGTRADYLASLENKQRPQRKKSNNGK